ncbi:MAG: fasciclin domain-containing protein [Cyclobacteriaceae bacterium]
MKFPKKLIIGLLLPATLFMWSCDGNDNQERDEDQQEMNEEMTEENDDPEEGIDLGMSTADKTIGEIVMSSDKFSTLAKAVQAAGLESMLTGEDMYTVYAPSNEAFEQLDSGVLENLLKPENKNKLVELISLHVVEGRQYEGDMARASEEDSVKVSEGQSNVEGAPVSDSEGEPMSVVVTPDGVEVEDADIVSANIEAKNGVIHIIASVLAPPVENEK